MTTPTRADIQSGLRRLSGLSAAVQALLPRLGDERLTGQELGSIVARDPILAARVLHLANSPFYGLSRQIGSLDEAVLILGVSQLRGMVLSTGLIALFPDRVAVARSLATAAAAGALARALKVDHGMAFTAGLLHNLGGLSLQYFSPELWCGLPQGGEPDSRLALERAAFGFDHCQLGADIAHDWHFPEAIRTAIRWHLKPTGAPSDPLSDLVHVAWALADEGAVDATSLNTSILARLGLDDSNCQAPLEQAARAVVDSRSAFGAA